MGVFLAAQKSVDCAFAPAASAPRETYTGLVVRLDLGAGAAASKMEWTVHAPPAHRSGALAGRYQRGSAPGLGTVLVESEQSVALQPLSPQGPNAPNIAAAVGELHLWFER